MKAAAPVSYIKNFKEADFEYWNGICLHEK
jgi:hypothetical protein